MKKLITLFISCIFLLNTATVFAQVLPGAYQTTAYFPTLANKRVAVFTNHTAVIGDKHLIDTLRLAGIQIQKIFTPEHGLRGTADAGEETKDGIDIKSGIKIVSLYGKKYGPDSTDLADVDILLFDIQDVGTHFYTYISSLQYFIEAAVQNNKPLIILDRPNPNGHYIDGPVLEKAFSSFVGMQPVPIVYGMTIGEYAKMLVGENWIKNANAKNKIDLTVIPCLHYDHLTKYQLTIAPSPNLANMDAIYWYPTTCLIEGTVMSEGRGTDHAFCYIGHPLIANKGFSFTPKSKPGATAPKLLNQECYGWDLTKRKVPANKIDLALLIEMYDSYPKSDSFFIHTTGNSPRDYYFNKLAGNASLMQQIKQGKSEKQIRKSWNKDLRHFKNIRKQYLLYPDFE